VLVRELLEHVEVALLGPARSVHSWGLAQPFTWNSQFGIAPRGLAQPFTWNSQFRVAPPFPRFLREGGLSARTTPNWQCARLGRPPRVLECLAPRFSKRQVGKGSADRA